MSHEHINPADVLHLKSPELLQAYCKNMLPPVRKRGNVARCACPFGAHTQPDHLELAERGGVGVALCRACNKGGSVLDVAAAVLGVDMNGHFAEVVRHVAETVGYTLRDTQPRQGRKARKGAASFISRAAERIAQQKSLTSVAPFPAPPPEGEFLDAENEAVAWAAVARGQDEPELMARHARALGIPVHAFMQHADMELARFGLLGLAPDGRLLYLYTAQDERGCWRVRYVKLRGDGRQGERGLLIREGRWMTGGLMQFKNGKPSRFYSAAGRPSALYGAESLNGHYMAFLTEGESDKLALDSVIDCHREAHQTGIDSPEDYIPEENMPVAVAKAGAGGFKPEWAAALAGKAVVIIGNNDKAGEEGMKKTVEILRASGALDVYTWLPPDGFNDARDMVKAKLPPMAIFNNIINKSILV